MIQITIVWIGHPCAYQIKTDATVRQLKQMIKGNILMGLRITKQDLDYNGVWLQDELKLEEYGIDSDVHLKLVRKLDLWISKYRDEMSSYLMLVNETTTVAKLKEIIAEHFGESNVARLRDKRKGLLIEDDHTLFDYGITDNSEITYWAD